MHTPNKIECVFVCEVCMRQTFPQPMIVLSELCGQSVSWIEVGNDLMKVVNSLIEPQRTC